jgi:hypothetical protein
MRNSTRIVRLALAGALLAALGLGGCGRKSALDPPPSASLSGNQPAAQVGPVDAGPAFLTGRPEPEPEPLPPVPGSNNSGKSFFLDWLLK